MKKYPAIAIVEFRDIAPGIHATDAMLKKAPISVIKSGMISPGRFLTLIGGTTASVDESLEEALFWARDHIVDHVMLPDVHPQLHDAVLGRRFKSEGGAMAIIETPTVSCNVRAAELALKGTPVSLTEIRLADSWLNGKGVSLYRGELHDIEAAVDLAVSFLQQTGVRPVHRIIPAPHEALGLQGDAGPYFPDTAPTELEGENF